MRERLGGRRAYDGLIINVDVDRVRLPNGTDVDLEVVRHPGAAAVLPVHADGTVLLVSQYRYAAGGTILEVPAGKLDPGEDPRSCARREVEEEAGVRAGHLHPLGWILTTPGFTDERIHLFAATELEETRQDLQEDEVLELVRMPFEEALEKAWSGAIQDAKSLCTLYRAQQAVELGELNPRPA